MAFVAHNFANNGYGEEAYILVDKFGRLYLSSALRQKFGIVKGTPFKCHVGYDADTGNIGLARPGEVNVPNTVAPASFDGNRYYASVRSFIRKNNVKLGKYVYIERSNNWYSFRLAEVLEP